MLPGLEMAASGLMVLANAAPLQCAVNRPPVVRVTPVSDPVRYDFSRSEKELTALRTDTVNPYAPGTETVTEGLRYDRPVIRTSVRQSTITYPDRGIFCMTFAEIDINIQLSPVIYIARENAAGACRDAVLGHEQKHVKVDREIMNEYAGRIGQAVMAAVNEIGTVGPMNVGQEATAQSSMNEHIESAIRSQELPLYQDMRRRQAEVDSLQEYERVSAICRR